MSPYQRAHDWVAASSQRAIRLAWVLIGTSIVIEVMMSVTGWKDDTWVDIPVVATLYVICIWISFVTGRTRKRKA